LGGVPLQMDFEVTGMEDVKVPMGTIPCYRVFLARMNQTFWFAADASRRLVKFEANNVVAELQNVRAPGIHSTTNYEHSKIGYTLTLPPGWLTADMPAPENLLLADPEMAGLVYIWATRSAVEKNAIERRLREDVEEKIKTRLQEFKDYKVRPETSQPRQIGQYKGFSCLADFADRGQPMAEYLTWIRSESVFMLFIARAEPAEIDGLRDRLDRLIESVQLK
jgi:hypothetical protein